MGTKKDPGRFTLHFNINDPQQKAAVDILERQGRRKAQLIARALQHYMKQEDPQPPQSPPPLDEAALEKAILSVLARHPNLMPAEGHPLELTTPIDAKEPPSAEQLENDTTAPVWDEFMSPESLHAIRNTLSSFRCQ